MKNIAYTMAVLIALAFCLPAGAVEKKCDFCHTDHMGTGTLLKKDINELCTTCHAERVKKGEHRVGMSPATVVKDLPLQAGKMTCVTCHNPHAKTASMLWKPARELCVSCHDK